MHLVGIGISLAIVKEMSAASESLRGASWGGVIRVDEDIAQANALIEATSRASEKLILSAQVRSMALSVRAALGLSAEYKGVAFKTLGEDLLAHEQAWRGFASEVEAKLPELAATFRSSKTDVKDQGRVRETLNATRASRIEEAERCSKAFAATAAQTTDLRSQSGQMMHICLSVAPGGNVIHAARLLDA